MYEPKSQAEWVAAQQAEPAEQPSRTTMSTRSCAVVGALLVAGVTGLALAQAGAFEPSAQPTRVTSVSGLEDLAPDAEIEMAMAMDFRNADTLAEAFTARVDAEMAARDGLYVRVDKAACYAGTPYQCTAQMSDFRQVTFTVEVASDGSSWELLSGRDGGPR